MARLLVALFLLFGAPARLDASSLLFTDVTDQTGITFKHDNGFSGKYHLIETVTAGLALFDYDNDGDIDIYFVNGAYHDGTAIQPPPCNALYRNDGNWRFTDVTSQAGVGDTGFGLGVAVADYDNDGDLDIYLNNHGPNVLYRNNGDGTFTDVTARAGVANGSKMGAGANFLDIDGDGHLDLYVSNYVDCLAEGNQGTTRGGHRAYLGPAASVYRNTSDVLYRNHGDGTFTDVSRESGIAAHLGAGMGTICGDIDNDGDTDIIVANDMSGNFSCSSTTAGGVSRRSACSQASPSTTTAKRRGAWEPNWATSTTTASSICTSLPTRASWPRSIATWAGASSRTSPPRPAPEAERCPM